jgi:hypothetical protein
MATGEEPLILGASGPSGPGAVLPNALNYLIGTKFNIVKGYRSAQETGLAFDRARGHRTFGQDDGVVGIFDGLHRTGRGWGRT